MDDAIRIQEVYRYRECQCANPKAEVGPCYQQSCTGKQVDTWDLNK